MLVAPAIAPLAAPPSIRSLAMCSACRRAASAAAAAWPSAPPAPLEDIPLEMAPSSRIWLRSCCLCRSNRSSSALRSAGAWSLGLAATLLAEPAAALERANLVAAATLLAYGTQRR